MYQRVILFLFMALAIVLEPSSAFAQNSLEDTLQNFRDSISDTPNLVSAFAYVIGIACGIWGLLKIKDHVDAPMQTPLRAGVLRLLAGGGLLSLPMAAEAVKETWMGGWGFTNMTNTNRHGAVAGPGLSLDDVLMNLMGDIGPMMEDLVGAFAYLFGLIFVVVGLIRLTKHQQEGPRGPSGMGTFTTFAVAGALLSLGGMMASATESLFGTGTTLTYANLSFTGVDPTAENRIEVVVEAVLGFLMIIGWISFARGWFILKAVADGGGQGSLMAGVTHIIGGALAVNLGHLINAVQETLGLSTYGITMN